MNIQEAIEKAGPGGKIRRISWHRRDYVLLPNSFNLTTEFASAPEENTPMSINDIIATDWEVVEPETIEVGDVVGYRHHPSCDGEERTVVAIDNGCGKFCLRQGNHLSMVTQDTCTLIRKGPRKHVFEGVLVRDVDIADRSIRLWGEYPMELDPGTYRMELTEKAE
jgi:hypothetical protein